MNEPKTPAGSVTAQPAFLWVELTVLITVFYPYLIGRMRGKETHSFNQSLNYAITGCTAIKFPMPARSMDGC